MRRRFGRSVFLRMSVLVPALAMLSSPAIAGTCSQVQLKDASGVIGMTHRYVFGAVCSWSYTESKQSFSSSGFTSTSTNYGIDMDVLGEGKWDRKTGVATEALKVNGYGAVKGPSGSFAGKRYAKGICNQDPFLKDPPGAAAVCHSVEVQYDGTSGPVFDVLISKKFLLEKKFFLAEAQALSEKKSAAAPPPAPPPPKPVPKKEPVKVSRDAPVELAAKPGVLPVPPPLPQRPAATAAGSGAPARQQTAQTPGLPDITSAPGLTIGSRSVQWGGIVSMDASEARGVRNGACDFAVRHTVQNASAAAAGTFHRRWTNSNVAGTWEMPYPSIPANGTVERVDTLPLKPGRNILYLTLDSGNAVAESNENNNLFRVAVDLGGACGAASSAPAPVPSSTPLKSGGRLKY